MFAQRKKVIGGGGKKRPPQSTEGIQFPADSKGNRSTSDFGRAAFAMSMIGLDLEAAKKAFTERNWRYGYPKHVIKNVELCCKSPEDCVKVCEDGLNFLHNAFEFNRGDKSMSLAQAMDTIKGSFPGTMKITGTGTIPDKFTVPYRRAPYPVVSFFTHFVSGSDPSYPVLVVISC